MPFNSSLSDSNESLEQIKILSNETVKIIQKQENITFYDYFSLLINLLIIATLIYKVIQPLSEIVKPFKVRLTKNYFKEIDYIEDILEEIMILTDSDRVCVGVFHNGDTWGQFHFLKMTIIYEARKQGITSIKKIYNNVPLEKIKEQLQKIKEDKFYIFNRKNDFSVECMQYLDSQNLKGILSRLISNKKGDVIAILESQRLGGYFSQLDLNDPRLEPTFNRLVYSLSLINEGKQLEISD